jgi:hypothetical protein
LIGFSPLAGKIERIMTAIPQSSTMVMKRRGKALISPQDCERLFISGDSPAQATHRDKVEGISY